MTAPAANLKSGVHGRLLGRAACHTFVVWTRRTVGSTRPSGRSEIKRPSTPHAHVEKRRPAWTRTKIPGAPGGAALGIAAVAPSARPPARRLWRTGRLHSRAQRRVGERSECLRRDRLVGDVDSGCGRQHLDSQRLAQRAQPIRHRFRAACWRIGAACRPARRSAPADRRGVGAGRVRRAART
jgi:hypothetical protein